MKQFQEGDRVEVIYSDDRWESAIYVQSNSQFHEILLQYGPNHCAKGERSDHEIRYPKGIPVIEEVKDWSSPPKFVLPPWASKEVHDIVVKRCIAFAIDEVGGWNWFEGNETEDVVAYIKRKNNNALHQYLYQKRNDGLWELTHDFTKNDEQKRCSCTYGRLVTANGTCNQCGLAGDNTALPPGWKWGQDTKEPFAHCPEHYEAPKSAWGCCWTYYSQTRSLEDQAKQAWESWREGRADGRSCARKDDSQSMDDTTQAHEERLDHLDEQAAKMQKTIDPTLDEWRDWRSPPPYIKPPTEDFEYVFVSCRDRDNGLGLLCGKVGWNACDHEVGALKKLSDYIYKRQGDRWELTWARVEVEGRTRMSKVSVEPAASCPKCHGSGNKSMGIIAFVQCECGAGKE